MTREAQHFARRAATLLAAVVLALAGCAGLAPRPNDSEAKKFQPLADRAVIYLVRGQPLYSDRAVPVWFGDLLMIKTYPDTYYRWEVPPGTHRISGHDTDFGTIKVVAEQGKVYFVEQQLSSRYDISYFTLVEELNGRAAVQRAALLKGY
jgi:hypothetical protein